MHTYDVWSPILYPGTALNSSIFDHLYALIQQLLTDPPYPLPFARRRVNDSGPYSNCRKPPCQEANNFIHAPSVK